MTGLARLTSRRPKVLEAVEGLVRVESGDLTDISPQDKIAIIAHWSASPVLTRSLLTYVQEFVNAGYRVVLVSSCGSTSALRGDLDPSVVVVRKPNVGYDFGSWAVGLSLVPAAATAAHVVLTNDSLVGPFTSFKPLLDAFEVTRADVWGLTDTRQFRHHLQSYFLGFRDGALGEPSLQRFWTNFRHESSRENFIKRGEVGLAVLLEQEGYAVEAHFKTAAVVPGGENPTIYGWHKLLTLGYPFVKRTLITNPAVARDGHEVGPVVQKLFGESIADWI